MKYMKLGSKPDIFQTSNNIVTVSCELASDITFQVEDIVLKLHKFPLLSKCSRLQSVTVDATLEEAVVRLDDIPGGVKAFELCAKFCYGISITLNAYNVICVRCAADYLGMTEEVEKGNLMFKLEVFLSSSIFKSWKDSIIALKTTKSLLPWSQDLQIVSRCIDSIASRTSVDPSKVDWSYTYTRKLPKNGITKTSSPVQNGTPNNHHYRPTPAPKDWWAEDICDLEIDFFFRVMVAIKTKGRMSHKLIGEALRVYSYRWLPGISKEHKAGFDSSGNRAKSSSLELVESGAAKHKLMLETIIGLLPNEKGSCSCSFMSRLLKAATILGVDDSSKMDLAKRIGLQLEEASLNDILVPSLSYANDTLYDVDLVHRIVDHFLLQDHTPSSSPVGHHPNRNYEKRRSLSADHLDFLASNVSAASPAAKVKVAKLIDAYLAEIARDLNLPLAKFIALAESIPEFARPVHDGLYRAIDIYLKEHPGLSKSERKKLCKLMDCKKLSMDACMHAAQNERLPLRVVVQVLFYEQVRTAMAGGILISDLPNNVKSLLPQAESSSEEHNEDAIVAQNNGHTQEEEWASVNNGFVARTGNGTSVNGTVGRAESTKGNVRQHEVFALKQSKARNLFSNSKRMLNRLLSVKHGSSAGSKDSDISKSSESSVSSVPSKAEMENTTPATATINIIRRRRHSIS
ncbi:hypothetical protein GOP47_0014207 [Adiantum capillus-veneris]|uniref:NPH3 domain-containing protein n=1 Tax=Adiantum capillus-veneris TaxID=13818 RepID=A0A9D4UQQ4_ADICA|nr:hypothetical protein GOP47_0013829 [Adiantum capillus-veneris]KAI5071956.1 hypothetical protein GOP47_0014207 [Adiantum capillus-veneris]